jgi:uracil-DNA glycosylase
LSALRSAYLNELGIQVWVPRSSEQNAESEAIETIVPAAPQGTASGLDWEALAHAVATCTRCALHKTRHQTVFGVGNRRADLLVVGEAPGAEEDRQGEPFVGRAGQLLTAMLRAIGLSRDAVYIANILKCRPPSNRDPKPEEAAECTPYLRRQIELIEPRVVLALGRISGQWLTGSELPVGRLRGQILVPDAWNVPLVVSYHPAYLLRSPAAKSKAWEDLLLVKGLLEKTP